MKRKIVALRLASSSVLLVYLLYKIDFSPLKETLSRFRPEFYILAIAGVCIYQYLNSLALKLLLSIKGNETGTAQIFRLLTISTFFGVFLPGGMGPDVVLAYNLGHSTSRKEDALSAIITARMMVLFVMVLIAFIFSLKLCMLQAFIRNLSAALLLGFLLFYLLIVNERSIALSKNLLLFLKKHRWTNLIYQTYFAVSSYGKNKKLFITILPISILTAILKVMIDYTIALSLGLDIQLVYFFIFVPLISIVTVVPVSISGIGVREGAYVGLLSTVGVKAANGFSISLLSFSLSLWLCIAGAILYGVKGSSLKIKNS